MEQQEKRMEHSSQEKREKRPQVGLSDTYLNLSTEAGKTYEGSFTVFSQNGEELSGTVLSTNDKVIPTVTELSGTKCRIPFYFKGRLAISEEEHFGDFLLITNGGEWNLPYCITVGPKKLWLPGKSISSIEEFAEFAKEDWKRAKDAFFSKEFKEVFILEHKKYLPLYQALLKGRSRDVILDNFLQETTGKQPLYFEAEWEHDKESEAGTVILRMSGWGYTEGRIYSKNGNVKPDRDVFCSGDFQDGILPVTLTYGGKKAGADTFVIETVYQTIVLPVSCLGGQKERKQETKGEKKDRMFSELLHYYVKLRTGVISIEEYVEKSVRWLASVTIKKEYKLFSELLHFQIQIVRYQALEDTDQADYEALGQAVEEKREEYLRNPLCRSYFYYLMALYKKDNASILEAALQIRDSYEKRQSFYDFWMLLYVDRNYALDQKMQCRRFYEYAQAGENSPLLYLGLLDVLNQNPYYLEDLEDHKAAFIGWGIRHGYLSLELSRHFAKLTMKEKYFRKNLLGMLMMLYELRQDEVYLSAICSMLIKGNRVRKEYHSYFEQALAMGLKIVGINEYYLRSLDFNSYPILPKSLLLYFNYSNSLDAREKAYLYTNILHYERQYDYIYRNYLERMEEFVREQMMEGRMNRYLQHLYEYFLPEILKDQTMVKYLPNIIFKKKLVVKSPGIAGVYVCHDEAEEEVYVPVVDGVCQVETYSERVSLYFADARANRYRAGITYSLSRYLNENKYMQICLEHNLENKKVLLKWTKALDEKGKDNERIANMILETGGMKNWMREKAVEQILDYHYEEKDMEDLNRCLDQINYKVISPSYRRTLMNYYMACNRMEDAYFGIELYGSDLVDAGQLYLLTCVGLYLHKDKKDDLLLVMAHRTFMNGKYNKEIVLYLREHLEGRLFDLLALWEVLKTEKLDTVEYEEKLLHQMLFTGESDERMLDVLLSYLSKTENDDLTASMLDLYSTYYFLGKKKVPDSFFVILESQAVQGNNLSLVGKLSYLSQKAKTGVKKEEQKKVTEYLEELCRMSIVFPFYEAFEEFFTLPPLLREMTFLFYPGEIKDGQTLNLTVVNGQGRKRQESILMEKPGPGFYFGGTYLLEDETISVQTEAGEERIKEHQSPLEIFRLKGRMENSRRSLLHRMEEHKSEARTLLREYEEVLARMDEQLFIL